MAKLPSVSTAALIPAASTLAPPPVASVAVEPTLEQWTALQQAAAARLPKCTIPLPCGTPGVNDERAFTRAAPVNCSTSGFICPWWLPVGTIGTSIRSFRAWWHVSQLGDLKSPVTQILPDNVVPLPARQHVKDAWLEVSKAFFNRTVSSLNQQNYSPMAAAPFGKDKAGLPISARSVSVRKFLAAFQDFVLHGYAVDPTVMPTEAELTEDSYSVTGEGGMGRWMRRGGFALYKPALEGKVPLKNVSLWACAEWCAGCPNPVLWPGGTPTCVTSIQVETENFDWGIFVKRLANEYVVTISRLPKSTWDKIEDGIRSITDQLDKFEAWMCRTYRGPAGQAGMAAAQSSTDPQTQIISRSYDFLLSQSCGERPSAGTQTGYDPANVPKPSIKSQTASAAGQLVPSAGQLAPLPAGKSNTKLIVGLGVLGLLTAGGAAVLRKRRRKS